ncbi:uncharacterized protein FIBRA_02560 [Fibroporia radiculosa]|uniref:Uncharacterized protein n=1 Tax=Fibroporia radiculosa TaxID=599839 RepID=J4I946_9APHY|nr:uncharacterized protein FIBRA_02560 [Fibroporia radiculosa]CCM00526.1 predicted protein [Fibroporia radiculosa]
MRVTTTLIAAAAIAAPLLVTATPSPSFTDLYAREEFAPYVSARDVYDAAAIFRRGNSNSKLPSNDPNDPIRQAAREKYNADMKDYRAKKAAHRTWHMYNGGPIGDGLARPDSTRGPPPQIPPKPIDPDGKPNKGFKGFFGLQGKGKREDLHMRALLVRALLEELD